MDLVPRGVLTEHPALGAMGPEPLSRRRSMPPRSRAPAPAGRPPLKVALLDQRVVAGLGQHLRQRGAASRPALAAAAGVEDRDALGRAARQRGAAGERDQDDPAERDRHGRRQRDIDRHGSASTIAKVSRARRRGAAARSQRFTQAGRSTFYCPVCQTGWV